MSPPLGVQYNLPPYEQSPAQTRHRKGRDDLWAIPGECLRPRLLNGKYKQPTTTKQRRTAYKIDSSKGVE